MVIYIQLKHHHSLIYLQPQTLVQFSFHNQKPKLVQLFIMIIQNRHNLKYIHIYLNYQPNLKLQQQYLNLMNYNHNYNLTHQIMLLLMDYIQTKTHQLKLVLQEKFIMQYFNINYQNSFNLNSYLQNILWLYYHQIHVYHLTQLLKYHILLFFLIQFLLYKLLIN